jgi:uncharacterized protein YndB with AHSA1/START domain
MTPTKAASTIVSMLIKAPRSKIYRVFIEPRLLARWQAPDKMSCQVYHFEASEGGTFRISLTYLDPANSQAGKTSEGTDTYNGRFLELVPDEKIVQSVRFESESAEFAGKMRITTSLADEDGRTRIAMLCENISRGIRREDNELGCWQSLKKLASLVE